MPHPCKSFHRLRFLTHPFCLPSTGLCFWPGVRLVVTFCPPPILWLLAPLVLSILLALLLVSWCISTFCALKLSPPIALGNSSQRMVLCIGHPLGSNFSLCLWTVRPLTRAGKFVMESCIQLLSCLLLDTTIQLHVFVVCLWRLVSISSSLVHWPRVLWIGSSLCCLMLVLRPCHCWPGIFFLASTQMSCERSLGFLSTCCRFASITFGYSVMTFVSVLSAPLLLV